MYESPAARLERLAAERREFVRDQHARHLRALPAVQLELVPALEADADADAEPEQLDPEWPAVRRA